MKKTAILSTIKHLFAKYFITSKRRWIIAGVFFLCEFILFLYPIGWLTDDISNFLSGEGSYTLDTPSSNNTYCQFFKPTHQYLNSIGLVFHADAVLADASASISITDQKENVLFNTSVSYSDITYDEFTDIPIELKLSPFKSYYLNIDCSPDSNDNTPSLYICGPEYSLDENNTLYIGSEATSEQLVAKYSYTDAMDLSRLIKCLCIIILTFVFIVFAFPTNSIFSVACSLCVLLAAPYIVGQRYEALTLYGSFALPHALLGNMLLLYLFEAIILLLTFSPKLTVIVTQFSIMLVYSVNYFVFQFRGTPLRINDISATGTAAQVLKHYDLTPNTHLAMNWSISILFIVIGFCIKKIHLSQKTFISGHLISLLCGIVVLLYSKHLLFETSFFTDYGYETVIGFDQHLLYQKNGYLIASCMDIQNNQITPPNNYSADNAEKILLAAEKDYLKQDHSDVVPTNIILIMNESFSDLRYLGPVELSEDNIPFFNSLSDNCIKGITHVSVYGGGTANSEFEVFTGCSMGFLPTNYYAYQECIKPDMPSLISMLESSGYTTISMHPAPSRNWNRNVVYPYLGFDKSFWIEDFENGKIIHNGTSDLDTYKKIIDLYENKSKNEKLFIFDLTMQNHGGYEETNIDVSISALNAHNTTESDNFLSLMKISDNAFRELINYFNQVDEPTLICMFGDHQPKFADSSFVTSALALNGTSDIETQFNKYKTPFVIWANYDIQESSNVEISTNYLGALLAHTANIELSPYFKFLYNQMEKYPIITVQGYKNSDNKLYSWDNNLLNDYEILQYHYLFE